MRAHPAGPRHGDITESVHLHAPARDLNALQADIWPVTAVRNAAGALEIGGCDVRTLAEEFATPLYVYDESDLRDRAQRYFAAYTNAGAAMVYYAAKAFLTTTVARWVTAEGLGLDVATGGELATAIRAGVPGERILLHGNNKSMSELEAALAHRVGRIVIDSFEEITRLADAAARAGVVQPVLVRVTLGVEAHTHEFIATAHEDQKFGLSAADGSVDEAVRRIAKLPSLSYVGLHSHIGSQIFDASGFELAASRVVAVAQRLWDEQGLETEELNLGGGMGIAYVAGDDPIDVSTMAEEIGTVVAKACAEAGIPVPALAFEPGRAIVGPAGVTLYEVGTIKPVHLDNGLVRTYVSVDGGMSDNIRTALYDADYTVVLASRTSSAGPMLCRIVGKHCESGDILVRDAWLPSDLAQGDLLAVAATGAYCRSMASNYNQVGRPAVIGVGNGRGQVLLRRESIEDLLRLDPGA